MFAPTEVDGRILGDGGLVDNVPVDVCARDGRGGADRRQHRHADRGRETLGSVGGLTTQMINILTEQNVQRSLGSLGAKDVLIAPELGKLTASDFERTRELIAAGERGRAPLAARLAALRCPRPPMRSGAPPGRSRQAGGDGRVHPLRGHRS